MGEVVDFVGHRYEISMLNYWAYSIYKNGIQIGFACRKSDGRFIYGIHIEDEYDRYILWNPMEETIDYETIQDAIRGLEKAILYATEDEDNIGTTWNWEDNDTLE